MVEMEMRVEDDVDVLRLQPEQLQRAGDGLVLASGCGFSKGSTFMHMVVVVAGVDQEAALVVLDQDRVDGKADFAAGPRFQKT